MNHTFYKQILTGNTCQLFEEQDNLIWVDWRDEEDAIVEAICDHLNLADLHAEIDDAENDSGYVVVITFEDQTRTIDPSSDFDCRHATINAVDELLNDHQIRFVTPTNGRDTIALAIESTRDWNALYAEFGKPVNKIFCPIREVPDLMNTPGNEIDDACAAYANRIS